MEPQWQDLIEDYDDAVSAVSGSSYQLFESHLQRWIEAIDSHPVAAAFTAQLEASVDFESWYGDAQRSVGSFVGSGQIKWPTNRDERLGIQLRLLRSFANEAVDTKQFAMNFLYRANDFNIMVGDLVSQIFLPIANDMRRRLVRMAERGKAIEGSLIPASDRVVKLDHNGTPYRNFVGALEKLEEALKGLNEFADVEVKEQVQTELSAGRRLLTSVRVRVAAIMALLGGALVFLIKEFAGAAIGKMAEPVLELLAKLLNIQLPF